ncbi:MAG TPA: twin-arginine translocase subunit TatC [Opitutales bacterium]|nr:twin-arginine translocase subunit TatC [Opitutales bacterium]
MNQTPIDKKEEWLEEVDDRSTMGFLDHLEELRWTLFKCAAAFFVAVGAIVLFIGNISEFLNGPYYQAFEAQGVESGGLFMISPLGVFTVLIQILVLGGLGLSMPAMLYFLASFIAPALKKEEMRVLLPACIVAFLLFLGGLIFSYTFIVPKALEFSIRMNRMLDYEIMWTADRYYSLLVWTMLGMGACFQFPLVVYILVYLRIVTTEMLSKARRYMIVLFFFLAALLTPTWDPFTQALVALPMWFLYEVSLFLARRLEVRREKEMEELFGDDDEGFD